MRRRGHSTHKARDPKNIGYRVGGSVVKYATCSGESHQIVVYEVFGCLYVQSQGAQLAPLTEAYRASSDGVALWG